MSKCFFSVEGEKKTQKTTASSSCSSSSLCFLVIWKKNINRTVMLIRKEHLNMVLEPPPAALFGRAILLIFALCLHWLAFTERGLITAPPQCVCVRACVCEPAMLTCK